MHNDDTDTGTVYIFQESGTGNLLLRTKDISVLSVIVPSQTIARNEKVIIEGVTYIVVGFEIEISTVPPTLSTPPSIQIEQNNPYEIHTIIYLRTKVHPLINLFYK